MNSVSAALPEGAGGTVINGYGGGFKPATNADHQLVGDLNDADKHITLD
ncbi:MAG: hypothetical protein QNJ63_27375 [Calothrix sp. MO_192.B10]|nr:hypothetical protein [Calothrix sp. MO_192.B10]